MSNLFNSPIYRISPYTTYNFVDGLCLSYLDSPVLEFQNGYIEHFYESGRSALADAILACKLDRADKVLIVTSSNCRYVSGCVTKTIDRYCGWTRVYDDKVKCVLIIHEFGKYCTFDYDAVPEGCFVIEDYAHSAWVLNKQSLIRGDFAIFSLSKFLNIKTGGLLLAKCSLGFEPTCDEDVRSRHVFSLYRKDFEAIFDKKKIIANYYNEEFVRLGGAPFFDFDSFECPGAYLFKIDLEQSKLDRIKVILQSNYIECSVFYGESAFFLPCNQNMDKHDVIYICKLFLDALGVVNASE